MDWDNDDLVPLSSAIIIAMGSALRDGAIVETAVDRTIDRSESAHTLHPPYPKGETPCNCESDSCCHQMISSTI